MYETENTKSYKKKKRINDINADNSDFVRAKNDFDIYDGKRYNEYMNKLAVDSKSNPKKFWQFVNEK